MRSVAELSRQFAIQADVGLTEEAVAKSRQQFGENRLTPLPRQPLWRKFLEKFDEPIIKILLAAALLSMVVDLFKVNTMTGSVALVTLIVLITGFSLFRLGYWIPSLMFVSALVCFGVGLADGHILIEGLAVMIAVILATGVAFLSEFKSDREFEVLNTKKDSIQVKVHRAGKTQSLVVEDVVVGDLVLLETGDEIPADGRVLKATEFMVDQSLMTGESEPSRKRPGQSDSSGPDQPDCVYKGTQVVDGVAQMFVTEVGDATYLGQIARRLGDDADEGEDDQARVKRKLTMSKELTPLQEKLKHLADLISKIGYVAAILIFLAQFVRGLVVHEIYWPQDQTQFLNVLGEMLGYIVTMVIIIVVAVPEGLPMSVTISLALAMRKMTRANSLVRQLVACETIGSATVICSDKTGTMTQNRMQVDRISIDSIVHERGSADWPRLEANRLASKPSQPIDCLALNAACNATANLEVKEGKTVTLGNSTEGALLHWLRESQLEYSQIRLQFPSLYQIHFSSERKRMTTVVRLGSSLVTLVKGAPEWVLTQCTRYLDGSGRIETLSEEVRKRIHEQLQGCARRAMRTLAFAQAELPAETPHDEDVLHDLRDSLEAGLVYVGFVAIRDPLRVEVKSAIEQCRQAGIDVKMITGDNVETARAIAYELSLIAQPDEPIDVPGAKVLTSPRFNQLTDDELKAHLPTLRVVARAQPLDKYRLVRLLQELGEVVAVTGDGTNDAPALKKADVGLAMGITGTEVSKEASKIVLLDDSFATIVKAVQWGRSLYENIQRFIQFQLMINVSALVITFLGILLFQVKAPFTVLQLLWINVIMDTFASIALCSEPPRPEVMNKPPKRRDENILSPAMKRNIASTAIFFVVVMLVLLVLFKGDPQNPGLFAGDGSPWSVEIDGARQAIPAQELEHAASTWKWKEREVSVDYTVFQVSLFFSIYVFFQVWNQINCRSLTSERSGFYRILENPTFLIIAALVALGQIAIITFGGPIFKVEPLSPSSWLAIIAFTSSVLVFAEIKRRWTKW